MASSSNLNSNLSIANDLMDAAIKNAKLVVLPEILLLCLIRTTTILQFLNILVTD